MKNRMTVMIGLLLGFGVAVAAEGIHFDQHGKIIAPDQKYLAKGIDAQALGYENDAMHYLKKSARYGNSYSQAVMGLMYLKKNEYTHALAWFKLIDLKMIANHEMLLGMMQKIETKLSPAEIDSANQILAELQQSYGKEAVLAHRINWQKKLSFGGSHIKGHVPNGLKIHVSGGVEPGSGNNFKLMGSGMTVNSYNLKKQLNEFVYEYDLKFINGEVKLKDFEVIKDDESPI
ncbi:hypothetical protein [Marinicella litoralis]|uniref:Tetratricopeptide repeat protein n=1 Tax=Marinicella litoralis TaxID=644220 RepID=A0A4R6XG47_9GAMM|nr:hypothetical protein [Marinicella litoralis]TDR18355.1 hypothetical protein C8D91_2272 [Marinicella litoralis]